MDCKTWCASFKALLDNMAGENNKVKGGFQYQHQGMSKQGRMAAHQKIQATSECTTDQNIMARSADLSRMWKNICGEKFMLFDQQTWWCINWKWRNKLFPFNLMCSQVILAYHQECVPLPINAYQKYTSSILRVYCILLKYKISILQLYCINCSRL